VSLLLVMLGHLLQIVFVSHNSHTGVVTEYKKKKVINLTQLVL